MCCPHTSPLHPPLANVTLWFALHVQVSSNSTLCASSKLSIKLTSRLVCRWPRHSLWLYTMVLRTADMCWCAGVR